MRTTILASLFLVPLAAVIGLVVRRRVRASRSEAASASSAIRKLSIERSKRGRGSRRAEGGGGDAGTAYDAAYGSDTSGGA